MLPVGGWEPGKVFSAFATGHPPGKGHPHSDIFFFRAVAEQFRGTPCVVPYQSQPPNKEIFEITDFGLMPQKMLVDATQPEETRVAVVDQKRLEEFDLETSTRKQLKGHVYLAKVVRIEPSLQAAFVEYGENRHGFLGFHEIHPDYFQIPVDDREKLLEQARARMKAEAAARENTTPASSENPEEIVVELDDEGSGSDPILEGQDGEDGHDEPDDTASRDEDGLEADDDESEDVPLGALRLHRRYRIQEVVRRHQVLLVQVVREERGSKGAALTTFISLAGRYCVLMPNTLRNGGVSRKIGDAQDRKRLKEILGTMDLPDHMGLIVRTAGVKATRIEIRKDVDYLRRLWDNIREKTLQSRAPSLIHSEGNLIRRCLRDMYTRDMERVIVAGEEGYHVARDMMKMIMPSHVKRIELYNDPDTPLFVAHGIDSQINDMETPRIRLRSGGSIVIAQTEALVAIDVNSGRATRERHINETALKTNLEAVDEIARQMRLRDLAGLIVIDFIDMDESRHRQAVERRLKEVTRRDRARIQIGHISGFGLLEMSRQRLRPSLYEAHSVPCLWCHGSGWARSTESMALYLIRMIEAALVSGDIETLTLSAPPRVALYLLNQKREALSLMEARKGVTITIEVKDPEDQGDLWHIEKTTRKAGAVPAKPRLAGTEGGVVPHDSGAGASEEPADEHEEEAGSSDEAGGEEEQGFEGASGDPAGAGQGGVKRRRRRSRRGRRRNGQEGMPNGEEQAASGEDESSGNADLSEREPGSGGGEALAPVVPEISGGDHEAPVQPRKASPRRRPGRTPREAPGGEQKAEGSGKKAEESGYAEEQQHAQPQSEGPKRKGWWQRLVDQG